MVICFLARSMIPRLITIWVAPAANPVIMPWTIPASSTVILPPLT